MITGEQLRAARAMLRLEQTSLAKKSNVSVETIKRLESTEGKLTGARPDTVRRLVEALEHEGVEFVSGDSQTLGGDGVRFSVDRTQKYRNLVANMVRDLTMGILSGAYGKDPKLFYKEPQEIADILLKELPSNIRECIDRTLENKVERWI